MLRWLKNCYHTLIAIVAVIWYRYPARKLYVIGITGTDGKTTTATLIYHLLNTAKSKTALISTVAAKIDNLEIDTGFHVTSPSPFALQKLLRSIVNQKIEYLVLEVTSHGLDQNRVLGANIKIALVTNITHEHLDYHRTYNRYLQAKAKIFKSARLVLLNADDSAYSALKQLVPAGVRVIGYSASRLGQYAPVITRRFPQPYNQANAIAVATLAHELKIKPSLVNQALATFPGVPGRLEPVSNSKGITIYVDFAHTPNGLKSTLTYLKSQTEGHLIVVFGAAGDRDRSKRPLMGEIAAQLADEVVLTAEDPRSENIYTIIRQIKNGIKTNYGHVHAIIDRQQAINFALTHLAKATDCVVICGKGHERAINLDGKHELPWSDVDAVKLALTKII